MLINLPTHVPWPTENCHELILVPEMSYSRDVTVNTKENANESLNSNANFRNNEKFKDDETQVNIDTSINMNYNGEVYLVASYL